MAKKQEIGDDWLQKGQVMEVLSVSERTLDRMVEKGEIHREYKPVAGRRPIPVFHPADVETAKQTLAESRVHVMTAQTAGLSLAPIQSQSDALLDALPALAEYTSQVMQSRPADKPRAAYVGIDDAVAISGLPRAWLIEQAQQGSLTAKKLGRWYFQRAALEAL